MKRRPHAPVYVSADERAALGQLAPVRTTVERLVGRMHDAWAPASPEAARTADVEALWAIVLEAYRRGAAAVHQGMHRAEGLDHTLADEALDAAMRSLHDRKQ